MRLLKAAFLACQCGSAVYAGPITFTESVTTSGSLDGTSFTNALVTIMLTGDTSSIFNPFPSTFALIGPASVTVAGTGSDTITDQIEAFAAPAANVAGFDVGAGVNSMLQTIRVQQLWPQHRNRSHFGHLDRPRRNLQHFGGTLVLNGPFNVDHRSTFTATTTPEPGTSALILGGLAGSWLLRRRRLR